MQENNRNKECTEITEVVADYMHLYTLQISIPTKQLSWVTVLVVVVLIWWKVVRATRLHVTT